MPNLLFCDSFDHYSVPQGSRKWTSFPGGTMVAGRTGNALQAGANGMPSKTLNAEYTTLTAGVAYRTQGFGNQILKFNNIVNDVKAYLEHVGDGRLRFLFQGGGFGTAGPPSTFVMNLNQWYYFEMQVAITGGPPATTTFTGTARVNSAEVLSWSLNGSTSATLKFAGVSLEGSGGGFNSTVDDFYCTDTEYLGDVKIGVLYPNAVGDASAWTPNGAGANWTKVMEHPADDDVTYVAAASTGLKDLYNLDDIDPAFTGVIKGVQALWCVKKSDEGQAAVKGLWKSAGVEIVQSSGHNYIAPNGYSPSAADYLYNIQTERKSLFTAADWTKTEINALQLGITRTV
jgi:hypothetical protein